MERVAAIILAAGFSSRLPGFKPLLEVEGRTLLERAIGTCAEAGIADILVVTGHRGAEVAAAVEAVAAGAISVRPVHNDLYEHGMYSSVQVGVRALPPAASAFFVLPVDCAFVRPETLGRLARVAEATQADVLYPAVGDERGHPPLVSAELAPAILAGDFPGGLRGLLERSAKRPVEVAVADPGVLFDLDMPADLERALALAHANEVPGEARCAGILAQRGVPAPVIAHSRAVANVAATLASALNERGQHLCLPLTVAAAYLHDVARSEPDHAEAGAVLLESLGYPRVAAIVRTHMRLSTDANAGTAADIGEAEAVYLADKLVLGDRVVSLEERFGPRLRELAEDPEALSAARSRLAAASAMLRRVEALLGHGLGPWLAASVLPGAVDRQAPG
jgi:molybdenum cofactor cytidylyltransferase